MIGALVQPLVCGVLRKLDTNLAQLFSIVTAYYIPWGDFNKMPNAHWHAVAR